MRDVVETSARLGLEVLTLYAFSVENWKRPAAEVSTLMMLLKRYLRSELSTLLQNNIRFHVIGRTEELVARRPATSCATPRRKTAANTGMLFNIALNYGGRTRDRRRRAPRDRVGPRPARRSTSRRFASFLYTAGQPDPDLLIRTSGEMRVSNFLLWQIAYAEIWVTDTLWPDFRCRHLLEGVLAYQKRDRRYGGIAAPVAAGSEMTERCKVRQALDRAADDAVLSGVVLGAVALALIWFLNSDGAARRRARRGAPSPSTNTSASSTRIGAQVPYWTTLVATLLACAMVPFPVGRRSSPCSAASLVLVAAQRAGVGSRPARRCSADTAAAVLAPVYIGLPLGSLVGVHAIAGREAVLLLIATVAVSDTAQFYTGRDVRAHAAGAARAARRKRAKARSAAS